MGETVDVGLNLLGDFAEQAEADAAAADKLGAALDVVTRQRPWTGADLFKVMEASAKTSYDAIVAGAKKAKKAHEDLMKSLREKASKSNAQGVFGEGWMNRTPTALQGPPPVASSFQKMLDAVGRVFGPKASEGIVKAGVYMNENAEGLKMAGAAIGKGGGALAAAGAITLAAAAALGAAAYKLGATVMELGIESTSRRQAQEAILAKLGGTYDLPIQLAARFGVDQDEAIRKVKQLLSTKLDSATIKQLFKIDVGISAVLGDEKAKAFLDKMAMQLKKGGKATEESMQGFAEAGINVDQAWKALAAKLGVSVQIAKGKVKGGLVDMKTALDAVRKSAEADFGGIAEAMGNSVPAKVLHLKSLFFGLFDSMDLGPLKAFLDNLIGALEGGSGAELKASLKDLFGALNHALFDPFKGAEGRKKMEDMLRGAAAVIRDLADIVRAAAPAIAWLTEQMAQWGATAEKSGGGTTILRTAIKALLGPFGAAMIWIVDKAHEAGTAIGEWISGLLGLGPAAGAAGNNIGSNLGQGLIDGMDSMLAAVDAAGGTMGDTAAASLKRSLGVASPAKVGIFVGEMLGAGVATGASNDNGVTAAGADIADRAMSGMGAGFGGASGSGGASGGGAPVIINIHLPPGSPAETQAAARAGAEEGFRQWQEYSRRNARDNGRAA